MLDLVFVIHHTAEENLSLLFICVVVGDVKFNKMMNCIVEGEMLFKIHFPTVYLKQ